MPEARTMLAFGALVGAVLLGPAAVLILVDGPAPASLTCGTAWSTTCLSVSW